MELLTVLLNMHVTQVVGKMNDNHKWNNEQWVKNYKKLFEIEVPAGYRLYQFAIFFTLSGVVIGGMV